MLDDVLEATIKYEDGINSSIFVTVLHGKVTNDTGGDDMEVAAGNGLHAFITGSVMPLLNANIIFKSVLVQRIRPLPRTAGYFLSGALVAGGVVGDMLPPQCSLVLRKLTAFAGRQYRGRLFQCGLSESDQNAGQWNAGGSVPGLLLAWDGFLPVPITTMGGSEFSWIVCDRFGLEPTSPIIDVRADSTVRTQRRRVRGIGS